MARAIADTDRAGRPYVRPGFLMARVINRMVRMAGGPSLTVRGRRTGRPITVPVIPFEFEGSRYIVSGGGDTHWARNLRAAGRGELRQHREVRGFRATELAGDERDRVVAAYRDAMGRRVRTYFARLPDPADHAAFRVDPLETDRRA